MNLSIYTFVNIYCQEVFYIFLHYRLVNFSEFSYHEKIGKTVSIRLW